MRALGIDPGQSGGLAWIDDLGVPRAEKMPETERDTWELIRGIKPNLAVIEKVHSMPSQGVSSTFKFGQNYGFLRGCLIALAVPFWEITPAVWQKEMECLSGGDKNVTKSRAQQLFPQLKITHYTADALLIAAFARRRSDLILHGG